MDITTHQLQELENRCVAAIRNGADLTNAKRTALRQVARAAARLRSELVMEELDQSLRPANPTPIADQAKTDTATQPISFGS